MRLATETSAPVRRDRCVRLPEALKLSGLGKSTLYELMRGGKFPRNVRLHGRTVAWSEGAILSWVQDRLKAEVQAPALGADVPKVGGARHAE